MKIQKDKIVLRLINAERNEGTLECAPHRMFYDLAVVYIQKEQMEYKNDYQLITNQIADDNNMSEEELFNLGFKNLVHTSKIVLKTPKGNLWTISNENDTASSALVLLDAPLAALAEFLDADLYLIPASIYEWLAAPANLICSKVLQGFLKEGNKELNQAREILSDHIYKYDRVEHQIYMVE